jgi:predicted ATPase/class 3 adenylate cyclase
MELGLAAGGREQLPGPPDLGQQLLLEDQVAGEPVEPVDDNRAGPAILDRAVDRGERDPVGADRKSASLCSPRRLRASRPGGSRSGVLAGAVCRYCSGRVVRECAEAEGPLSGADPVERLGSALPTGLLTFLFTDIEGSTRLVQEIGTDGYGDLQAQHSRLLREAVAAHGGQEFGTEGDAHFFVFGDAAGAVRAAVQAQRGLAAHRWPAEAAIRVRMGLHTGKPAVRDGNYVGVELNRVARITAAGHGGQVLVSQATRDGAQPDLSEVGFTSLGSHRLKDLAEPIRIYQVQADGLALSFPAIRTIDTRTKRLPAQLTSFVGREREIREVAELLERDRLVTLSGPGGSGKTRLAVLVADRLLPRFEDGVFFVPLAPVHDPEVVSLTIAGALGVKEGPDLPVEMALEEHLRNRCLLLVLDNFEHLLPAAPVVTRFLVAASQVKVLATSRTRLRVYGERDYVVPPLPIPEPHETSVREVERYPAVRLFLDRAAVARPGFGLSANSATTVAELCRRLDGLPLAIELAAARIRLLSPAELLGRLSRRLGLEGVARDLPERQRTLRATIDWSHQLLDVDEARLFAQLSIFAGGWTRHAAEGICGQGLGMQVLDGLEALVDHSLVQRGMSGDDELRFYMLETIREYAQEQLNTSGQTGDLARRHARYFLELARDAEPHVTGPQADRRLTILRLETDNLHSVLRWAMDQGDPPSLEIGLGMAAALWRFWQQTGALREARQWLEELLARATDPSIRSARARALIAAGSIAYWQTDLGRARRFYEQAVELYRELGDRHGMADALYNLASIPMRTGDPSLARRLLVQARDLWIELGDHWQAALATMNLGYSSLFEGEFEQALPYVEEFLPVVRARGDRFWLIHGLIGIAEAQRLLGRFEQARQNFGEALRLAQRADDLASVTVILGPLSNLEGAAGDHDRAVRLWAACESIKQRIGGGPSAQAMRVRDPSATAASVIGEDAVGRAWAEGWAMAPEEAVRYATRECASGRTQFRP